MALILAASEDEAIFQFEKSLSEVHRPIVVPFAEFKTLLLLAPAPQPVALAVTTP
ncbi:MAG: hypothetical protein IPN97_12320 [Saprospiraceae bacterium]|nr:hypothetical protein [Saprospiraceae bacterium]